MLLSAKRMFAEFIRLLRYNRIGKCRFASVIGKWIEKRLEALVETLQGGMPFG